MLDVGCWILDAGCWILDAGCWMLDAGCSPSAFLSVAFPFLVFCTVCFWLFFSLLFHTYLFYPLLLKRLARSKKPNAIYHLTDGDLPFVSVIMSVYNEEKVIAKKLETLFHLNYPADRLRFYVGSDCSSDQTKHIVEQMIETRPAFHFFDYSNRSGKPGVINRLVKIALERRPASKNHVFLITDASVFLQADTLFHLVKHFKNEEIAIVDAHMKHEGMRSEGISEAENEYISGEFMLKYREGLVWGKMIGPFGGCYALRSDYFFEIPSAYLVDDFYIAMRVLEKGGKAISDLKAVCYETVSHEIQEEYRRKARISAGNFQNMLTFPHLWWPPIGLPNFAFFSHKIIRWLGPFLLFGMLLALLPLALSGSFFYSLLLLLAIVLFVGAPALDIFLSRLGFHFYLLRGIRYFFWMNVALLAGFIRFLKGIKSNVWDPPKRSG